MMQLNVPNHLVRVRKKVSLGLKYLALLPLKRLENVLQATCCGCVCSGRKWIQAQQTHTASCSADMSAVSIRFSLSVFWQMMGRVLWLCEPDMLTVCLRGGWGSTLPACSKNPSHLGNTTLNPITCCVYVSILEITLVPVMFPSI